MNTKTSVSHALTQRIIWADSAPNEPIYPGGPTRTQYVEGLIRRPGMGSYVRVNKHNEMAQFETLAEVYDLFTKIENTHGWSTVPLETLHEANADLSCNYYIAPVPNGYYAHESVKLLEELTDPELEKVRIIKGPYGLELKLECGYAFKCDNIIAITDNDGLVTWFPGRLIPECCNYSQKTTLVIRSCIDIRKAIVKIE